MVENHITRITENRADIRVIPVSQARQLRALVLRPGQTPETLIFPGDDEPETLHFGAFEANQFVGIVTIMHRPPGEYTGEHPEALWLLRGMATISEVRGRGYGAALVRAGCAYVARQQGTYLWCEGRESALGFYQKLGFAIRGDRFDVPVTGPHFRLWREITPADGVASLFQT